MHINTDLDVDTPDKVSRVLRNVADKYRESHFELISCWQDPNVGKVWLEIAKILERAAVAVDKTVSREV